MEKVVMPLMTALLTGGCGLFLLKWLRDLLDRRTKKKVRRGYEAVAQMYQHLQAVLNQTPCHRAMLLKSENGGGVPGPGRTVTTSVVHEVFDHKLQGTRDEWHKRPVDAMYSQVLVDLMQNKHVRLITDELSQQSELRDHYEKQDIKKAHVYEICSTPDAYFYLSLVFLEVKEMKPEHRAAINSAKAAIQRLMGDYHHVLDR